MKRNDLQSLRGVAILLVLLFHLHPNFFPLGFVGVDMFFVLSGFLMTMILSKTRFSCSVLLDFYSKRFKRIVPLMYIVLAGIYIGCAFLLFGPDKNQLKIDITWSASILSNIQPIFEVFGYWDQIVSYRFLVHYWSLGVEIQFYFIAPFVIFGTNHFSSLKRKGVLLFSIASSLYYQLTSVPKVAYGFLASRIWQFLLGSLCYEGQKKDRQLGEKSILVEENDQPERKVQSGKDSGLLLLIISLLVIFNEKFLVNEKTMRILGSIGTAIVIRDSSPFLTSNRLLAYFGDLSYVMYLIHWPIIVATKYIQNVSQLTVPTSICISILICLLSIILHHTIEKFILSSSLLTGFILSALCLSVIFFTFPYYHKCCSLSRPPSIKNINITEAIEYNDRQTQIMYFDQPCEKDTETVNWTNYTDEPELRCQAYGNGTAKILVIGNSMAYRAFPLISRVLRGRYRELRLYCRSGQLAFLVEVKGSARPPLTDLDPPFTKATHIVVDNMQPDILWNIHVCLGMYMDPFDEKNKTKDPAYLQFERNINYYQNRTKVFLIDLPFYWTNIPVAYEMAKRLRGGLSVDDLKIDQREMEKVQMHHRQRIKAVPCEKCVYLDVESRMVDGGTYWFFNRKNYHSYLWDGAHFTEEMLDRLEPLYQTAADNALKKIGAH